MVKFMTKQDVVSLYGAVECTFNEYHKYKFHFSGIANDGAKIHIVVGGDAADIYRIHIDADEVVTISDCDYDQASVVINGNTVWSS